MPDGATGLTPCSTWNVGAPRAAWDMHRWRPRQLARGDACPGGRRVFHVERGCASLRMSHAHRPEPLLARSGEGVGRTGNVFHVERGATPNPRVFTRPAVLIQPEHAVVCRPRGRMGSLRRARAVSASPRDAVDARGRVPRGSAWLMAPGVSRERGDARGGEAGRRVPRGTRMDVRRAAAAGETSPPLGRPAVVRWCLTGSGPGAACDGRAGQKGAHVACPTRPNGFQHPKACLALEPRVRVPRGTVEAPMGNAERLRPRAKGAGRGRTWGGGGARVPRGTPAGVNRTAAGVATAGGGVFHVERRGSTADAHGCPRGAIDRVVSRALVARQRRAARWGRVPAASSGRARGGRTWVVHRVPVTSRRRWCGGAPNASGRPSGGISLAVRRMRVASGGGAQRQRSCRWRHRRSRAACRWQVKAGGAEGVARRQQPGRWRHRRSCAACR